ncbi:hypothetical protein M5K25_017138 [Dendrobium thyrsiflorum]|uniref:Uracil-DNA glycosylase n=1 Tax=Dendrobium thyrsiflorum TaxID=117978 RepID=A0ABD0ULN1_DENTH
MYGDSSKMASSTSKSLAEILQPVKRLRSLSPSRETLAPRSCISIRSDPSVGTGVSGEFKLESPSSLTVEQRSRMEFNKYLARSKRNVRLCIERIENAKAEGIEYAKLEELLMEETWLEALQGELQNPYWKNLCRFVESELRGVVPIYPPPHLIFNALNSTPFDRVKAVIIGQDPYHGPGQAMGLAFSVPEGIKPPSSLINIFKELQKDVGCSIPMHGNLERWAVQQWSVTQPDWLYSLCWRPPPQGWLKINKDGTLSSSHMAGSSIVIKGSDGDIQLAVGRQLEHWDNTQVELNAVTSLQDLLE